MRHLGVGPKAPAFSTFYYVQAASYGVPIPIVYGLNRCAPTMIHLPLPLQKQGGKKGGGGKGAQFFGPVIFGICEGPITGLGLIWVDKGQPTFYSGHAVSTGGGGTGVIKNQSDELDTVPATGPYTIIVQAVGGAGTYLADINVYDNTAGTWLTRIPDNAVPSPAAGQYQLDGTLNGKYYFNSAQHSHAVIINYYYGTTSPTPAFPGSWVLRLGTSPLQTVWSELTAAVPAQAVTYPGIAYMAHPAALFPGGQAQQFSYEVAGLAQFAPGASPPIYDANGADILTDFLTNALHGANFPAAALGDLTAYRAYCAAFGLFSSPVIKDQQAARSHLDELFEVTNAGAYWSDGLLKVVPYGDTAMTANGYTYTPNTTPLYSLTDVDFLPNRAVTSGQDGGAGDRNAESDPVVVTRKDPTTIYNMVKVEYMERAFDYNANFYVAEDLASETLNGPLPAPALTLHSITTAAVAQQVAQVRLQREQHIAPTSYQFVLGWKYSLLEPMDLVTITDALQGLVATPVRITAVEELQNEEGLSITAEPYPAGAATAVAYPAATGGGSRPNANVLPGSTSAPFIIEGPAALITAAMELWIGASGGVNWGGCNVWISTDNVNFVQVGQITAAAAYGTLQPSGLATSASQYPSVDSVNTATVTIADTRQLVTLSATDFARLTYPCVMTDGTTPEWMAYETAALVSGSEYSLSTLYRGLFGTAPRLHANTDGFMMIDAAVAKIPWAAGVQGSTIYVKLPAFNLYGAQTEDLSTVSSFTYVIGGVPIARHTAAPGMTITIATNDSLTVATAKASMVVSGPSDAASIKWLASTSAQPTVAAVIAGGTVVSTGAPFFTVADLGVALNLGDTVYVTAVYYDILGNARTGVQGHATRPNLLATKGISVAPSAFSVLIGTTLIGAYILDATTSALTLNSTLTGAQQDVFTAPIIFVVGTTITGITLVGTSKAGIAGVVSILLYRLRAGVTTLLAQATVTAGAGTQTVSASCSQLVQAGDVYFFRAPFIGPSTATGLAIQSASATYTMPNPTTAY